MTSLGMVTILVDVYDPQTISMMTTQKWWPTMLISSSTIPLDLSRIGS